MSTDREYVVPTLLTRQDHDHYDYSPLNGDRPRIAWPGGAPVAVCVIGAVFGELVGAKAGLGYLMTRAMAQFATPRLVAAIVLLSLMGVGLFAAIGLIERLALPWRRYTTVSEQ